MPAFPEFCGPSAAGRSLRGNAEKSVDLYLELLVDGGGQGKNKWALYQRPGLSLHRTLTDSPMRGLWAGDQRLFAAAGGTIYEVFGDPAAAPTNRGSVFAGPTPVQFFPNGNQLFIVASDQGYLDDGLSITPVIPARTGAYLDGYFIAALPQSNKFQISSLLDGRDWDPLDYGVKQGYPDNIASILAAREELILFGTQTTEFWRNTGNANFPFERSPMGFSEIGSGAPWSPASLGDNTICWLGSGITGSGIVLRLIGYKPVRISTHTVESAIQKYGNVGDAVGYPVQVEGHNFYHLSFPSANATWVYDATTSEAVGSPIWHERQYWDPVTGTQREDLARFHAYTLGTHWVGDYRNGKIYKQSSLYGTDNGDPIRRLRRSPHVFNEAKWVFYNMFQVDMEAGHVPASGPGSDTKVMVRWSDDGGETFSSEVWIDAGKIGDYKHRVILWRLGRSRDRVFEVVMTDAAPMNIVGAFLELTAGTGA